MVLLLFYGAYLVLSACNPVLVNVVGQPWVELMNGIIISRIFSPIFNRGDYISPGSSSNYTPNIKKIVSRK